ncbi:MAG: hypothetical protein WBR26_21190 [Candidatus Acidiferrum sp.]
MLMNVADYRNFGRRLNDAKEAGMLDWDMVSDETREWHCRKRYETTISFLQFKLDLLDYGFHIDYWADQPLRPEVWIEKQALLPVIAPVCREFDVPYYPLKGWGRPADKLAAAQRFAEYPNQTSVVLHAGDHDATGCWVTRNLARDLLKYGGQFSKRKYIRVCRIGLNCPIEGRDQLPTYRQTASTPRRTGKPTNPGGKVTSPPTMVWKIPGNWTPLTPSSCKP